MCEQTCICSIFARQAEYKEQMRVRWETHRACTYSSCTDCQRAQHCAYNVHFGGFPSALYSAACSQVSTAPCTGGGSTLWAPQPLTPQRRNVPLMRGDLSLVPHSGICGRAPRSVLAVNPFLPNGSSQRGAGPRTATHTRLIEPSWRLLGDPPRPFLYYHRPTQEKKGSISDSKLPFNPLGPCTNAPWFLAPPAPQRPHSVPTHPADVQNIPENTYVRVRPVHAGEALLRWTLVCSHCSAFPSPHRCWTRAFTAGRSRAWSARERERHFFFDWTNTASQQRTVITWQKRRAGNRELNKLWRDAESGSDPSTHPSIRPSTRSFPIHWCVL